MIRIPKINSLGNSQGDCVFADSKQKKKLLISEDGSATVLIDEEIKTSKFTMETKDF